MSMKKLALLAAILVAFTVNPYPAASAEPDWGKVDPTEVTLFYPGQTSWEFLLSKDHGLGARNIKRVRKSCTKCHTDETGAFDLMAEEIASGKKNKKKTHKPFEPEPIAGKKGFMKATLQAAYDDEYVYLRIKWASKGSSWKDPSLYEKGLVDRVAVQLNKDHKHFKKYGCFIACHDDLAHMPKSPTKEEVKKNPYYSKLGRDEVKLYAFYTRKKKEEAHGGWADILGKKELKALQKQGLMDLWEVEFEGQKVKVEDEWIFEDRQKDTQADLKAEGRWADGYYSVVLKRKLSTGDSRDVELSEGDTVTVGLAIHEDKMDERKHYVTFPLTIGIGAKGDVRAKKVK